MRYQRRSIYILYILIIIILPFTVQKQWVNLPANRDKPDQGTKLTVTVSAVANEGDQWPSGYKPKAGEDIFLKATFDAKNSKRTAPAGSKGPGGKSPPGLFALAHHRRTHADGAVSAGHRCNALQRAQTDGEGSCVSV